MKKLFLFLLFQIICTNTGFAPWTVVLTNGNFFRQIQYLSPYDWVNCFNAYDFFQIDAYHLCGLYGYEAPVGIELIFDRRTSVLCDPQQLFRLYHNYEWIRACDIEAGCLLLDIDLRPVEVTRVRLIHRKCYFYRYSVPFVGYYNFFVTDLMINVCNY